MSITSALVLYAVIWAILFYLINPLWQISQHENGDIAPGTPASAPVDAMVKRKAIIATVVATVLFVVVYSTVEFHWLTLDDVSFVTLPSER